MVKKLLEQELASLWMRHKYFDLKKSNLFERDQLEANLFERGIFKQDKNKKEFAFLNKA